MLQPFDELSLAEPGCPKDVVTVIPSADCKVGYRRNAWILALTVS